MRSLSLMIVTVASVVLMAGNSLGNSAEYRSETLPLGRLTRGLVDGETVAENARAYVADRVARARARLDENPDHIIQKEILHLYSGCRAGKPRLVFNENGPESWWVPLEKRGEIGSFLKFEPNSGEVNGLPMWRPGGEPMLSIPERNWGSLEEIVARLTGVRVSSEARLVRIQQGYDFTLYLAIPSDGKVVRIDVTSLGEPGGFAPNPITRAPSRWAARSCIGENRGQGEPTGGERRIDLQPPSHFELAVLPPVKDQDGIGACAGFAASTTADWWHCGNICYGGTGNSAEDTCECPKMSQGECACIDSLIISAQYCYDRARTIENIDCFDNPGTCSGCPSQPCQNRVVTDGAQCGNSGCFSSMACGGIMNMRSTAQVLTDFGPCTWDCQPFGAFAGCSDGGRENCTGDCPNVTTQCGEVFRLTSYVGVNGIEEYKDALYHHGMLLTGSGICICWAGTGCYCVPDCDCSTIGGHGYVLIGYDQDLELFYFQNSWGTGWGNSGRGELSYGFVNRFIVGSGTYYFEGIPADPIITYGDSCWVEDSLGNGDQRADPGEAVELSVLLRNEGRNATGVWAVLSSQEPQNITLIRDSTYFGDIGRFQVGDNSSDPFAFAVSDTCPPHDVIMYLMITAEGGYANSDTFKVRIGRPDILLVDDDQGGAYETWYRNSLDSLGIWFDEWNVESRGLVGTELLSYPCVIWFTGDDSMTTLTAQDESDLAAFLDAGNKLFITGQNVGEDIGGDLFYTDYLHAAFVSPNSGEYTLEGVPGDEIGDGLNVLTIGWPGAGNQTSQDVISPSPDADSVLVYSPGNTAGVKYAGTYKVVYFGFGFEGIASRPAQGFSHADTVMYRVLYWLDPSLVGVEEGEADIGRQAPGIRLLQNYPNPFTHATTITYSLQGSGGAEEQSPEPYGSGQRGRGEESQIADRTSHVTLTVYDVSGRLVGTLMDAPSNHLTIKPSSSQGGSASGGNQIVWDGRDNRGAQVPSGIYFYRLTVGDPSSSSSSRASGADRGRVSFAQTKKMVLLR